MSRIEFEQADSPEDFYESIRTRAIGGINKQNALEYAKFIHEHNPPKGILQRILDSLTYIDKETFDNNLSELAQMVIKEISERPYVAAMYKVGSNTWMLDNLVKLGVPAPRDIYIHVDAKNEDYPASYPDRHGNMTELPFEILPGTPVLVPDDMSLSGAQIGLTLTQLRKVDIHPVITAVLYASSHGREMIRHRTDTALLYRETPSYMDSFSSEDMGFLRALTQQYEGAEYAELVHPLNPLPMWMWSGIPDNIEHTYINLRPAPLVERSSIVRPYPRMDFS